MMKRSLAAVAFLLSSGMAQAGPMSTAGQFEVSPTGAATYTIPIQVPPGTAGIEPKLSLVYNSQSGNGLLGVGWSLSGLSAITRCPRTMAQDGIRGGVNYDLDDRYCLDGQRLMAINGTYGGDGTEYRTERESFSKVVSYGSAGNGPAWFRVWTKAGQILEYGNTADSQVVAQGKITVRVWAMNKLSDTDGNYFSVAYSQDKANGAYYPSRIDYTSNSGNGLGPSSSVRFSYEARNDIAPRYEAGSIVVILQRLATIQIYEGQAPIRAYRLAYEQGTATRRTRISSIVDCDAASVCRPPITSRWQDDGGMPGSVANIHPGADTIGAYASWMPYLGDFNGDGKMDVLWVNSDTYSRSIGQQLFWLGNGDGSFVVTNIHPGASTIGPYASWKPYLGDFNGDGKADVLWVNSDTYGRSIGQQLFWLGNGDGSFVVTNVHPGASTMGAYASWKPYLGDFNGDGKTDVLWVNSDTYGRSIGQQLFWLGNGDGSFVVTNVHPGASAIGPYASWRPFLGDFSGDGKTDVLWVNSDIYGRSIGQQLFWIGNGDGSFVVTNVHPGASTPGAYASWMPYLGDFNGDGETDVLWVNSDIDGRSIGQQLFWFGKGNGSFAVTNSHPGSGTIGAYASWKPSVGDFNGDGQTDVLWVNSDTYGRSIGQQLAWSSNGDGTFALSTAIPGSGGGYGGWRPFIADFNGDGRADVLWVNSDPSGRSIGQQLFWIGTTGVPDLDASIASGLGIVNSVTYIALSQSGAPYVKNAGFAACAYPCEDLQPPMSVVSSVSTSNGIGGTLTANYEYGGLRAEMGTGRGLLGFGWMEATNPATGITVHTDYLQDWPYVGLPSVVKKTVPSGGNASLLSQTSYIYGCLNPQLGSACTVAASNRYFPYVSQSTESGWDVSGVALPTVTTTNQFDAYGNATQVSVSASDGISKTTTNTYNNDATNWYLGRLLRSQVQSVAP